MNSHSNTPSSFISIQTWPGLFSLESTLNSKLEVIIVTFLSISIVVLLFIVFPCSVTSTVAKPPVKVLMLVDSPEALANPKGAVDNSNKNTIEIAETRFMTSPVVIV